MASEPNATAASESPPALDPGYLLAFRKIPSASLLLRGGTVVDATDEACRSLDRSRDKVLGLNLLDLAAFAFELQTVSDELSLATLKPVVERDSESLLRHAAHSVPALLSYIGPDYRFLFANDTYEEWFGRPARDLIGRTIGEVIGDEAFESVRPMLDLALNGEPVRYRRRMPYADGGHRVVETTLTPDRDAEGRTVGFVAHIVDVGESHRAEEALRTSEARFRFVAESSPAYVWTAEPDGLLDYVNRRGLEYVGLPPEKAHGNGFLRAIHPEDLSRVLRAWARGVRVVEEVSVEHRLRGADGTYRWLHSQATPMRGENGAVVKWFGVSTDIHDLKLAEQRLRQVLEQSPMGIQVMGPRGQIVMTNPAWERLWGVTMDMVGEYSILDDPQIEELGVLPYVKRAFAGEAVEVPPVGYRPEVGLYEGTPRWVRSFIYPVMQDGQVREVVQMHEDISGRIEAEKSMRESEQRYRSLVLASSAIVWNMPASGQFESDQPAWRAFTGQTSEELSGWGWLHAVHPDDRRMTEAAWRESVATKRFFEVEHRLETADGGYRTMLARAVPILNADGSLREWVGIHADITDRKEALEAQARLIVELETERGRLREIFAQAPALIATITFPELLFETANDRFVRFLGRGDLAGAPVLEVMPDLMEQGFHEKLRNAVKAGHALSGRTVPIHLPGGQTRYVDFVFQPMRDGEGNIGGLFAHGVDVTEQVRARQSMEEMNAELERRVEDRTQKLRTANEEMEGFTYTVSHDLRAPLRAIHATSRILEEDFGDLLPEEARNQLTRQGAAARRMGILIDELLKLSRISRVEMKSEVFDLSQATSEVLEEIVVPPGVNVEIQPAMRAKGDAQLVRFILQNLLENAIKFSPNGGTVRVGASPSGAFFVSDQGIGFDMKYANKLFLPFERLVHEREFPGTGIGLANVERIAKRHGGRVWAEGEPGKGSTFWFTLAS